MSDYLVGHFRKRKNFVNPDLNIDMIYEHFAASHTHDARVSEVPYLIGLNDPNYFKTCFKKEFDENHSQIGDLRNSNRLGFALFYSTLEAD